MTYVRPPPDISVGVCGCLIEATNVQHPPYIFFGMFMLLTHKECADTILARAVLGSQVESQLHDRLHTTSIQAPTMTKLGICDVVPYVSSNLERTMDK